jgi:hypothetical protein
MNVNRFAIEYSKKSNKEAGEGKKGLGVQQVKALTVAVLADLGNLKDEEIVKTVRKQSGKAAPAPKARTRAPKAPATPKAEPAATPA